MPGGLRSERGLTLVEVTLMLVVSTAIMAGLAPAVYSTIRMGEIAAANTAMTDIKNQMLACLSNMAFTAFTTNGVSGGTIMEVLVSDGDIPRDRAAFPPSTVTWQALVNNSDKDFLERHLVTNNPGGLAANDYPYGGATGSGWRGPYLTAPIDPDPWGNRYMVNALFFGAATDDVVVYSAGPDEEIDSSADGNPFVAVDDDLFVLVEP